MAAVTREQIHEMLDLILDINGMEARTREQTGDKPTAFMMFNGHTYDLEIQIHKNGWVEDNHPEIDEVARLSDGTTWNGGTIDDVISLLKAQKKTAEITAQTVSGTDCLKFSVPLL